MKLYGYIIGIETIGLGITKWNDVDLNGNVPFKISNTTPIGYKDISSIVTWDDYATDLVNVFDIIKVMRNYYETLTYSNLTIQEKGILSKWFVNTKSERDALYSIDIQRIDAMMINKLIQDKSDNIDYILNNGYINYGEINNNSPHGELYFQNNTNQTLITNKNAPMKIIGTTLSGNMFGFTYTNGRLIYSHESPNLFNINVSLSAVMMRGNSKFTFYITVNGLLVGKSGMSRFFRRRFDGTLSLSTLLTLNMNDYIEIYVENNKNKHAITISDLNINIH